MREKTLEEWINCFEKNKQKRQIKMLNCIKKEILSKTNLFIAEKSVIKLVFEKYITQLTHQEDKGE